MAITVTKPVTESYDPNITDAAGGLAVLAGVNNANPAASRILQPRPLTFSCEGQSVGNEAVTIALLAPVNLTLLGVLFPASSMRVIRTKCWSRRATVAQAGYAELAWVVIGGPTPSVVPVFTLTAGVAAANNPQLITGSPNNNSATAPEYGEGMVVMDAVSTTNVLVGVQNILGTSNAAVTATLLRWRLEVFVEPLVGIPVAA